MKKILLAALIATFTLVSFTAHAFGHEKMKIEGRDVRIAGVEADGEHEFSKKEVAGGIYIVAAKNFMVESTDFLPKTTAVIRQRFIDRGFKVVDSPEQASIGIRFSVNELNCDVNAKSVMATPALTNESANTAGTLAGVAIVGLLGGAGAATSAFNMSGGKSTSVLDLELSGNIVLEPKDHGMSAAFIKSIKYSDPLKATYYVKDGSSPEDVLTIMADQWIENYID